MREIKFRAWDKVKNEYIYTGLDHAIRFLEINFPPKTDDIFPPLGFGTSPEEMLRFDYEQFTGIRDKNGRDIFEGDIVRSDNWNPECYEIRFIEGGFCGWRDNLNIPTDINMWFDSLGCHIEVIGNIHENPELMD